MGSANEHVGAQPKTKWVPAARALVDTVATFEELSAPLAMDVVPSKKVTVPVGTAVPDAGETVAVKVTLAPEDAEDGPVSAVVVATKEVAETETEPDAELALK